MMDPLTSEVVLEESVIEMDSADLSLSFLGNVLTTLFSKVEDLFIQVMTTNVILSLHTIILAILIFLTSPMTPSLLAMDTNPFMNFG
jgi:hypothetical protein